MNAQFTRKMKGWKAICDWLKILVAMALLAVVFTTFFYFLADLDGVAIAISLAVLAGAGLLYGVSRWIMNKVLTLEEMDMIKAEWEREDEEYQQKLAADKAADEAMKNDRWDLYS